MISEKRKAKTGSLKAAEGPSEGREIRPPRRGEPRLPSLSNSKGRCFPLWESKPDLCQEAPGGDPQNEILTEKDQTTEFRRQGSQSRRERRPKRMGKGGRESKR